jgi:hypothetical protein
MPKLSEDLFAVPDGEVHPRWFRAGEEVTGDVAKAAEAQGKLGPAKKRKARAGAKAAEAAATPAGPAEDKGLFAAPENK